MGSSEPDVIIGSDKEQNRGCRRKGEDHMYFLCKLQEAQAARGRHFVHEQTSTIKSRMRCVTRIMLGQARNKNTGGRLVHVWIGRL